MDFIKRKSTVRCITALDLSLTALVLLVSSYKIVEAVLLRLSPIPGEPPISSLSMSKFIIIWFGFFALHVFPLCIAFALFRVTRKGREEVLMMISKSRTWLKSTLYLLIALFIMFILFSLDSEVQSYIGAGLCGIEFLVKVAFRCFIQAFYESLK